MNFVPQRCEIILRPILLYAWNAQIGCYYLTALCGIWTVSHMAMWIFIIVYAAAISVGFFVRFLWLPSCSSVSVYFTFQFIRLEDCLCYVYCAAFFFLSGVLLNLFWFSCDLHKTFISSLLTLVVSKAFSSSFIIIDLALLPISYLWNMVHRINFILFIPLVRLQTHKQNLMNERF